MRHGTEMSEKVQRPAPAPRQHDAGFAQRVEALLEGIPPDSAPQRLADALACAALSVLASPELSSRLVARTKQLLRGQISSAEWSSVRDDLRRSRTLCYDEGGRETHVTVEEAARRLAVNRSTVRRWLDDPEQYFSYVHDDHDLVPDRIPVARLAAFQAERAEKKERVVLRERLLEDLPSFEARTAQSYLNDLSRMEEPLTVRVIQNFADHQGLEVSPSTIRRWPSAGAIPRQRGRPAKFFAHQEVADQLARRKARERRSQIASPTVLIQTLRRLDGEVTRLAATTAAVPDDPLSGEDGERTGR